MDFLNNKQDHYLLNNLTYASIASVRNIFLQLNGIIANAKSQTDLYETSVQFLSDSLSDVLASQKSLDIIESRINTIDEGIEYILKTRYESNEPFKAISLVDLSKGKFTQMIYDINLRGLTFDSQ